MRFATAILPMVGIFSKDSAHPNSQAGSCDQRIESGTDSWTRREETEWFPGIILRRWMVDREHVHWNSNLLKYANSFFVNLPTSPQNCGIYLNSTPRHVWRKFFENLICYNNIQLQPVQVERCSSCSGILSHSVVYNTRCPQAYGWWNAGLWRRHDRPVWAIRAWSRARIFVGQPFLHLLLPKISLYFLLLLLDIMFRSSAGKFEETERSRRRCAPHGQQLVTAFTLSSSFRWKVFLSHSNFQALPAWIFKSAFNRKEIDRNRALDTLNQRRVTFIWRLENLNEPRTSPTTFQRDVLLLYPYHIIL